MELHLFVKRERENLFLARQIYGAKGLKSTCILILLGYFFSSRWYQAAWKHSPTEKEDGDPHLSTQQGNAQSYMGETFQDYS